MRTMIVKTYNSLKRKKNEFLINRKQKKQVKSLYKKKLVIIQIDGLSYDDLIFCMNDGYAPFLKKLINEQQYFLKQYNPGLVSTTPVIQAGILYGDNNDVAGFRFVDKERKKAVSLESPLDAFYLENTYYKDKKGLLADYGSSYFNHFSGTAERSMFTMSTLWKQSKLQKLKQTDLLLIFLANPLRIVKVAYLAAYEIIIEHLEGVWRGIVAFFKWKRAKIPLVYSLVRMNMNVICRELATLGTIIDMSRDTPIIYTNYIGYDEVSHHRGPSNKSVYRIVRAIDRNIKRIWNKKPSEYEMIILSDHGQTEALPFKCVYKQSLGDFIQQLTAVPVSFDEEIDTEEITLEYIKRYLDEASKKNKFAGLLTIFESKKLEKEKKKKLTAISIATSCNLAQIYFLIEKKKLVRTEIDQFYPDFISELIKHHGIGVVFGRGENHFFILTKEGEITFTATGEISTDEDRKKLAYLLNNYKMNISHEIFIKQILKMMQKPLAGDLIIIGSMIKDKDNKQKMISFVDHFGSHGAFGGKQTNAFIITKDEIKEEIYDATQIHKIIKERYCR
ncbi:alkaline phosphatase family protein [Candidatus Woesearchaeota archaeon]|nr:alkaline phosphatase family protein [Candidatus Woesearchaeota archaeon]